MKQDEAMTTKYRRVRARLVRVIDSLAECYADSRDGVGDYRARDRLDETRVRLQQAIDAFEVAVREQHAEEM